MVDITKLESIELDGVDTNDYPDFCDAFITYAEINGRVLTDHELDCVNDNHDSICELAYESLI